MPVSCSQRIARRTLRWLTALAVVVSSTSCTTDRNARITASGVMTFAENQMSQDRFDSAAQMLEEARSTTSDDYERAKIALLLGDCYLALDRFQPASESYYRCRTINDSRDSFLRFRSSYGLGRCRDAQGKWLAAERHFLEAASFSQDNRRQDGVYILLGRRSLERADLSKCLAYLNRVHDQSVFGYSELARDYAGAVLKTKEGVPGKPAEIKVPSVLAPEVLSRQRWGAGPLRPSGDPKVMNKPWRITVHHSASPATPPTLMVDAVQAMRSFQRLHQDQRGWADIGYHYIIDGAGRIWQGRDLKWEGAHAGNAVLNQGNIGVCLMGNFVKKDPTPQQKQSLRRALTWLCEAHAIHPRFVAGHRVVKKQAGIASTLCPGARLESYLIRLRPFLPRP